MLVLMLLVATIRVVNSVEESAGRGVKFGFLLLISGGRFLTDPTFSLMGMLPKISCFCAMFINKNVRQSNP